MGATRLPLVLGLAATALLGGLWLLLAGPGANPDAEPAATDTGAAFSPAERDELGAPPVDAGAAPDAPDPFVDFADPEAVARGYVAAGYSVVDTDAGHTNRRAIRYAAPSTPPHTVGVLVVTPPAPGHTVVAMVTDVAQVSGEPSDTRRGYLVGYQTTEQPSPTDQAAGPSGRHSRYLLLVRQFDGRWLVAGDTPDTQVGEP